jgi:hypothetical protein
MDSRRYSWVSIKTCKLRVLLPSTQLHSLEVLRALRAELRELLRKSKMRN